MMRDLVLNNRYRLLERIAAGGMGEVWRATDEILNRSVAVKLLRQEHVADESARIRFQAEARFAAALQHGGIAQVYDYGEQDETEDGAFAGGNRAYLVMELVPGQPLSKVLRRDGPLAPEETLDIVGQAARALQVAHTAGIIHRDVKPANLMVTDDGTVKITDFGIARGLDVATVTQTGMVMGTAHYISPEQASGKRITPATDLYSLGAVAFECLTGRPPFEADTPVAIALKHVRETPPELPAGVPDAVRELVATLLAKDPAERPVSAWEVAELATVIRDTSEFRVEGLRGEPADSASSAEDQGPADWAADTAVAETARQIAPAGRPERGGGSAEGSDESDEVESTRVDRSGKAARGGKARTLIGRRARAATGPAAPSPGAESNGADQRHFATPEALDTLASGEVAGRRRPSSLLSGVAAGVLLLGAILVVSLMRGPDSADLVRDKNGPGPPPPGDQPRSEQPMLPGPGSTVRPSPSTTTRFRSFSPRPTTTSPTPKASLSEEPKTSPTKSPTPEPTPTPTKSTPTETPPTTADPPTGTARD